MYFSDGEDKGTCTAGNRRLPGMCPDDVAPQAPTGGLMQATEQIISRIGMVFLIVCIEKRLIEFSQQIKKRELQNERQLKKER